MNNLFNFLYMLIYIGPFALLRYYPFRDKLRISVKTLVALYLVLILIEASLFVFSESSAILEYDTDSDFSYEFCDFFLLPFLLHWSEKTSLSSSICGY